MFFKKWFWAAMFLSLIASGPNSYATTPDASERELALGGIGVYSRETIRIKTDLDALVSWYGNNETLEFHDFNQEGHRVEWVLEPPNGLFKPGPECEEIKNQADQGQPMYPINCQYVLRDVQELRQRLRINRRYFMSWKFTVDSLIKSLGSYREQGGSLPEEVPSGWWSDIKLDLTDMALALHRLEIAYLGIVREAENNPNLDAKALTGILGSHSSADKSIFNILKSEDFVRLQTVAIYFEKEADRLP